MKRFHVQRTLPMLWEVTDGWCDRVEFVLFADIGINHARLWVARELLEGGGRSEALRMLADRATRAGVVHSFRPPPRLAPTYAAVDDCKATRRPV